MNTTTPTVHLSDRRSATRFPIQLDLDYRAGKRDRRFTGSGKTTNMSSTGIYFRTDEELEPETSIEALISWPVRLHQTVPLKLRVQGRVVRREPGAVVLEIQKYDFHTARS